MSEQTDLIEWLRAQLGDDERVARRAAHLYPAWTYDRETFTVSSSGGYSIAARKADGSPINDVDGDHIARHDPARVLAKIAAKRRIVDLCAGRADLSFIGSDFPPGDETELAAAILGYLALPYADRPGYRDEWRP